MQVMETCFCLLGVHVSHDDDDDDDDDEEERRRTTAMKTYDYAISIVHIYCKARTNI